MTIQQLRTKFSMNTPGTTTRELYQNNSFRGCVHANVRPDTFPSTQYV